MGNLIPEKPDLRATRDALIKFKEEGKKIIGIIAHGIVPDELIFASNCIPIHFCLGGTEEQMTEGHTYLSQTTCGFQRVNLGIFEEHESVSYQIYDLIDVVISGTFCNGVQNTGMYLENYFDKEQYKFIIPHTNKPNAFEFYLKEVSHLKSFLEKRTGLFIPNEKLIDSIKYYNKLRSLYREIDKFRYLDHPVISLNEIQNLIHHLYMNGPEANYGEVERFLELLQTKKLPEKGGVRIFLSGNGILYEDGFVSMLENCDCLIAGDDLWTGSDFYSSLIQLDSLDPLIALAERYLNKSLAGRMIPDTYRVNNILKMCKEREVQGIVNNYLKFCDSYSNSADFFKQRMKKEGFPVLNLERDYSENSIGQLRTRIEAFMEML